MGKLIVRIVDLGEPQFGYQIGRKRTKHKNRPGYCRACGSKLTDELSLKRGYGRECFERWTAVTLEFVPDGMEVTA